MDVRVGLWRRLSDEELMLWTVVLEKTLESPLDCKEVQPDHPKGDQSWMFIGRNDAEAETPILWPPRMKSDSLEKTLMLGGIGSRRIRGRQDEMAGWHHRLYAHEFGWTPGVGDGQGGLACCGSWGSKESNTTERLNWTDWLLRKKVMTNLDSSLKSTDITLPTKVHLVKAVIFPVVIYGCDSWTIKIAECQKLILLNCGVGEDSWESLGLQGDPTSPS